MCFLPVVILLLAHEDIKNPYAEASIQDESGSKNTVWMVAFFCEICTSLIGDLWWFIPLFIGFPHVSTILIYGAGFTMKCLREGRSVGIFPIKIPTWDLSDLWDLCTHHGESSFSPSFRRKNQTSAILKIIWISRYLKDSKKYEWSFTIVRFLWSSS